MDDTAQLAVVQLLFVDHPKNTLESVPVPFVIFVVLLDVAALDHVGNPTPVVAVVQVILPLFVPVTLVPALFLIVPVPPFLLNVIVFVFAEQLGLYLPLFDIVYPVGHDVV